MFWDSSAIIPLLVEEASSVRLRELLKASGEAPVLWWATPMECTAALTRAVRDGRLEAGELDPCLERLAAVVAESVEVRPVELVRARSLRLLRVHPLRPEDALQLAAALVACEEHPEQADFVSLDDRLREAARREGFRVRPA